MSTKLEVLEKRHKNKLARIKKRKDALLVLVSILELEEEKETKCFLQEKKVLEEEEQIEGYKVRLQTKTYDMMGQDKNLSSILKEWGTSPGAIQFIYTAKPNDDKSDVINTWVYLDPVAKEILNNLVKLSSMTAKEIITEAIKRRGAYDQSDNA